MRVKCSLLSPSCVNILTASAKRGRNPRGLCHVKCSFMFCKVSATAPSTSMKWRVTRKPLCGRSLLGLTDKLNDWLAGKMTALHAAGLFFSAAALTSSLSLLLTSPVFQHYFFFFSVSHTLTSHSKKTRAEGRSLKLWGGRRTHGETERAAEMKRVRIKQMERSVQKVMRPKERERLKGVW